MESFLLSIGAHLHSASRCRKLLDSIVGLPSLLYNMRKDIVAYNNILCDTEEFIREYKLYGGGSEKIEQDGLSCHLLRVFEPLLRQDGETLGKIEVLVRKYTNPLVVVGKLRWSDSKSVSAEKELEDPTKMIRDETTTMGLVMSALKRSDKSH